ncbi:MAG: hypothetical protein WCJ62_03185 [Flavobacterium sp.]
MNKFNLFFEVFVNDFQNFIDPSKDYKMTYAYFVIICASFFSCFIGQCLASVVYKKTRKKLNLLDSSEFTLKAIFKESLCAVLTITLLFVFKIVLLNVYSVFFFSVFWMKVFVKLLGQGEKDITKMLNKLH